MRYSCFKWRADLRLGYKYIPVWTYELHTGPVVLLLWAR